MLPIRRSLRSRGIEVDPGCPFCGIDEESSHHILMLCPAVQAAWFASSMSVRVAVSSLHDLMIAVLESDDDIMITQLQTWLYVLWEARNAAVFHAKPLDIGNLLQRVGALVGVPVSVQQPLGRPVAALPSVWKRPRQGATKINVDATMQEGGAAFFALVARNFRGEVLAATTSDLVPCLSPKLAETQALQWAMIMASELGFRTVCFETDCLQLYNGWKNLDHGVSYFSTVLANYRTLVWHFNSVSIYFVRRTGNKVADNLARHASSFPGSVWIEEVPPELVSLVLADVLASIPPIV
ncbi:uncharacterized protein LOC130733484 [Lotus japonicus]|uniref:uncharacterized protein LOC130733484 n=1 Tax=Lotus japonicus TaxID=34305 RepID=UPI0025827C30|nr:uncharacterized protein LOC130733484 [Lotus japonicus]